jgi:hypothetical protein
MRSAAVGRGLALAISFLLLCIAGGEAGHALAGLEGHGIGSALLATHAPCDAPGSAQPHDARQCLLCRAARILGMSLNASGASALPLAAARSALPLPEVLAPHTQRSPTEAPRAPPARSAV